MRVAVVGGGAVGLGVAYEVMRGGAAVISSSGSTLAPRLREETRAGSLPRFARYPCRHPGW
jgi:glycine/D-amino acid oxidase-like deaminating enzyme